MARKGGVICFSGGTQQVAEVLGFLTLLIPLIDFDRMLSAEQVIKLSLSRFLRRS